jgi:hypothetical protein
MKILKAELSPTPTDGRFYIFCNTLTIAKFGLIFDIELNEDDLFQVHTIIEYANKKIDDKSIYDHAKEKFDKAIDEALDVFVKKLVSRE